MAVAFSMVGLRRRSKACPAMSGRVGCWRHPVVSCTGARTGYILAELSLEGSTGAVYGAINCGDVQVAGLRRVLAGLPLSAWPDGGPAGRGWRNWLRPDAVTVLPLLCAGQRKAQLIPGWPYSFSLPTSRAARRGCCRWTRPA